jgi:hypothetical protein
VSGLLFAACFALYLFVERVDAQRDFRSSFRDLSQ